MLSCEFTGNVQNSFLWLILNFPKLEYHWIFITFYAVVLEYAFTSRTGWKKNENEIGYVHTTERKIRAITVGSLTATVSSSERAPKNEKRRRIERTTKVWVLCFRIEPVADFLVYRPSCDNAHALPIRILKTLRQVSLWMLKEI